jgi:AmpD protein
MRFLPSPHFSQRPAHAEVDLIVLHAISLPPGEFELQFIEAFFMKGLDYDQHPSFASLKEVEVSAHFVVDRKGGITQFVPLSKKAWHAGVSSWRTVDGNERKNCNDYSVGIEMIGDEKRPFTQAQYRETARLCRVLIQQFPSMSLERIVGHQDVAPDRKWDPGKQWDWAKFKRSFSRIRKLNLVLER